MKFLVNVVRLPWKPEQIVKPMDNKALAIKRADNLKNRLGKNPSLESGYDAVLQDLEEKGIVYEVPVEELTSERPVFHPPHRPVVREASTRTKIRPVFDAPVKGLNGVAFDDGMEAGPNLIPSLIERMLRFGRWKCWLPSDITKALLQTKVAKQDQDVHRFIWDVRGNRRIIRFDRIIFGNA